MTLEVASSGKSLPNKKRRWGRDSIYTNLSYLFMVLPGAIWLLLFAYLPMPGVIMAFKDYKLARPPQDYWIQNKFIYSLIQSPWVGLENFRVFDPAHQY
ncbi:MAG: hypothetical protein R2867_27190 [Caldilineaceae bacterium]